MRNCRKNTNTLQIKGRVVTYPTPNKRKMQFSTSPLVGYRQIRFRKTFHC